MATVTDIIEYPTTDTKGKVLKTVTIKGEAGKQIKIESTSLQLYSGKDKITNNTVVAINGEAWAAWNWSDAGYSDVLEYKRYSYSVDAGKDAVLTWTVKTSDVRYSAKMKNASYTYSYVDVTADVPAPKTSKALVEIECDTEVTAKKVAAEIQAKGIITDDMNMFIAKSV